MHTVCIMLCAPQKEQARRSCFLARTHFACPRQHPSGMATWSHWIWAQTLVYKCKTIDGQLTPCEFSFRLATFTSLYAAWIASRLGLIGRPLLGLLEYDSAHHLSHRCSSYVKHVHNAIGSSFYIYRQALRHNLRASQSQCSAG